MRQFVIIGHEVPTTPEFSLDDLAGGAGRLDVLCRCVSSALFVSHGIREEVTIDLVLDDTVTVRFEGATARNLHPDERTIAARVRQALEQREEAIGHLPAEPSPGVKVYRLGLADMLDIATESGQIVRLHQEGTPIVDANLPEQPIFVLSDHQPFTEEEQRAIGDRASTAVSVGSTEIHANHTIAVAHNYLDTEGYTRY